MTKRYDIVDDEGYVYYSNMGEYYASQLLTRLLNDGVDAYLTESDPVETMMCSKKYVITETESLISPAGYHPEYRIFVQTKIAIHCDVIPKNLPKCNLPLYAHEIEKIIK